MTWIGQMGYLLWKFVECECKELEAYLLPVCFCCCVVGGCVVTGRN